MIGGLINFKVFRLIYGRLFARDQFNAAFDEPHSFFKPFTFSTILGILTSVLPIMVASICGLIFLNFGYQLTVNSIEMLILESLLLILQLYENFKLKSKLIRDVTYYKVEPKLLDNTSAFASM
jgi:hypothetical protein